MVTSTAIARYVIVLTAGLLQLVLALALGMTMPAHPFDLWIAFTFVAFAFIGLGLVIATLADNVPAVQALGQCIFLPMLIIGGVAVQLSTLPLWAQHVSAFFPGRYAVETIQASVTGTGIPGSRFSLLALALVGIAGCLAGGKLFRWDAQQRFAARTGKVWLLPALASWAAVGLLAEWRGRIAIPVDREVARPALLPTPAPKTDPVTPPVSTPSPAPAVPPSASPVAAAQPSAPSPKSGTPIASTTTATSPAPVVPAVPSPAPAPALPPPPPVRTLAPPPPPPAWMKITKEDIDGLDYRVPPDNGIVSPMSAPDEEPEDYLREEVDKVRKNLPSWPPGLDGDDIQNIRNLLYVAGVPDAIQLPVERYLPRVVYEYLLDTYSKDKLTKILTYIAMHPEDGTVIDDISDLGVEGTAGDPLVVRERAYLYAIKYIARLSGKLKE